MLKDSEIKMDSAITQSSALNAISRMGVLFIVVMLLFYFGLAAILNNTRLGNRRLAVALNTNLARLGGQEARMTGEFSLDTTWDVVVTGSSHAYRGYDPNQFSSQGIALYNWGSSAQHPSITYHFLQEYLPKLKSKPFIIMDVYDKILELDGDESAGRLIVNCSNEAIARHVLWDNFGVNSLNNYLARVFADKQLEEIEVNDYVGQGYCARSWQLLHDPKEVNYQFSGNEKAKEDLERCFDWLSKNHYQFVIVSHPMPKQKGFEDYHAYSASYLNALAQKFHTVFLDYTSHPDFHLSHKFFSDETHLNQNGVEKFNAILIDTLLTSGFLSIGMR